MHKSLTRRTNQVLISCWAIAVAGLNFATSAGVAAACGTGAIVGVAAGISQSSALRADPQGFARAVTALDVRRVLMASPQGKLSVRLVWINGLVLLVHLLVTHQVTPLLASWFAGYFAFMLVRDTIAYGALRHVATAASALSKDA